MQARKEYSVLVRLALPVVVGQLGMTVQGVIDTVMLGRYSTESLAAAGFVNSMFVLVSVIVMGFAVGVIPLCGAAYGRGDTPRCASVLKNGLATITLVAVVATAVMVGVFTNLSMLHQPQELSGEIMAYFWWTIPSLIIVAWGSAFKSFYDSLTLTKVAMFAILIGNLWNVLWNYLLIFGALGMPRLGVTGAAIATTTSRIVIFAVYIYAFLGGSRFEAYRKAMMHAKVTWRSMKQIFQMGGAIAVQSGFEVSAFSLCSVIVGWISATDLAAHQIMTNLSTTIWVVYFGIATATSVRVSNFMGRGERERIRFTTKCSLKMILCCAVVLNLLFITFHNDVFALFTDDATLIARLGTVVLPIVLYQFSDALQTNYVNVLRGMGRVRYLMLDAFVAYVVASLPTSYVLGIVCGYGLRGVWLGFPIALTVAASLYIWRYRRYIAQV